MKRYNGISIIIPTQKSHLKYLKKLLITIKEAQNTLKNAGYSSEVIVVDSSANEYTNKLCNGLGIRYFIGDRMLTKTRNIGIRKSAYDIIFFIDSDCYVDRNFLIEHIKIYEEKNNEKLGGVLGLTVFEGKSTLGYKIMKNSSFALPFRFATLMEYAPWGTCTNISFKKKILETIGGFDENWPLKHGGEDVDLGWRVNDAGYYIATNPKAVVYHTTETWSSFIKNIRRVWNWGRADYYLFKKFPNKRCLDIIKYPVLWLFITLYQIICFLLFKKFILLGLILLFIFMNMLMHGFLAKKQKNTSLVNEVLAEFFFNIFELGFILEGIKNLDLSPFYQKILHTPNQLVHGWPMTAIKVWTLFITLAAMLMAFVIGCLL